MIRVLQVVTYMGRGGLETMLMNYYRNIDREKIQFDFLVHRDFQADYDEEIIELGGKIFHLPRLVPWSSSYRKRLDEFFASHPEYKIVHVHQDCLSSVILKAAWKHKIPVRIAHSHSASQDKNLKYLIKLYYKKFIPKYATDLLACGKEAGDWMFGSTDYQIINNAVAVKHYLYNEMMRLKIRHELGLKDEFVVGLVARFVSVKNHSFLLDIFHALQQMDDTAKLMLVGDGELREAIEKKINELGLNDKVLLTGVCTEVANLLQAMDVFVMPSLYEGLSLAIVEAQSAGLPCFISDRVSIECKKTDLVQQISLKESPKVWAEKILRTKGMTRRNTYEEIAQANFDIEKNAEWLQQYYLSKAGI